MASGPAPTNFNILFTTAEVTLAAIYQETDADLPDIWKEYATEKTFPTFQHMDAWIGMLAKPREWIGARIVGEPAAQTYTVIARPWEHTTSIDRFTSDADIYGVFASQIVFQARQVRRLPTYWTRDLIEASGYFQNSGSGVSNPQLGTDGLTFFNTAHLQGVYQTNGPTFCNDFTGGGVAVAGGMPGGTGANITVGGSFSPTAFMTLAEYMMQYKGEDGEPLGVMPTTAMFPATLFGEAMLVLRAGSFAPPAWATITGQVGAADNPILRYGVFTPLINRFLTNGTRWYLFDGSRSRKPLGWGVHKQPVFAQLTSETSEPVFMRHNYVLGYHGYATPFWGGFPWLMSRSGP